MERQEKIRYFEYLLKKLLDWNAAFTGDIKSNDFTVLKSLKLLFFVSAASGDQQHNPLVEHVFDKFVAMPYGHVESDVYDEIKERQGDLQFFSLNSKGATLNDPIKVDELDPAFLSEIDNAIENVKVQNPKLVLMSQFDLVDLSHTWYSWQKFFSQAKENGQRSMPIPAGVIIGEDKIYNLTAF